MARTYLEIFRNKSVPLDWKHRETGGAGGKPRLMDCIMCLLKWEGKDLSIPGLRRSSGEGHGKPFQYSCLKNPMDRGAWRATVCGVTKSWTWLKWLSMLAQRFQIPTQLIRHNMETFPMDMDLSLTLVESARQPSNQMNEVYHLRAFPSGSPWIQEGPV